LVEVVARPNAVQLATLQSSVAHLIVEADKSHDKPMFVADNNLIVVEFPSTVDNSSADKPMPMFGNRLNVVVDNSSVKGSMSVADSLLAVVTDKPSATAAEPQVAADELLTMVADKPLAAEPMHNIDNRLPEPVFDAEKLSAVRCDNRTTEQFYQHPQV